MLQIGLIVVYLAEMMNAQATSANITNTIMPTTTTAITTTATTTTATTTSVTTDAISHSIVYDETGILVCEGGNCNLYLYDCLTDTYGGLFTAYNEPSGHVRVKRQTSGNTDGDSCCETKFTIKWFQEIIEKRNNTLDEECWIVRIPLHGRNLIQSVVVGSCVE